MQSLKTASITTEQHTQIREIAASAPVSERSGKRTPLWAVLVAMLRWGAAGFPKGIDEGLRVLDAQPRSGRVVIAAPADLFDQANQAYSASGARSCGAPLTKKIHYVMLRLPEHPLDALGPFLPEAQVIEPAQGSTAAPAASKGASAFSPRVMVRIQAIADEWGITFDEAHSYLINSHPTVLLGAKVTPAKIAALAGAQG